jgi:hypothetical protein
MQLENIKDSAKKGIYSIDQYEGAKKWCFGLVLNRALDNINPQNKEDAKDFKNKDLLYKSVLRFEGIRKQSWFDGNTKNKITPKVVIDNTEKAAALLVNLRNYFSHCYHTDTCLYFPDESPNKQNRQIMEDAYERAKAELASKKTGQEEEKDKDGNVKKYSYSEIPWPPLFDERYKITSAGVVFFASFFTERSQISRLMGSIEGLKRSDDKFNMTRRAISFYSLPDSFAESVAGYKQEEGGVSRTIKQEGKMFRDILGYLRRIPSETYKIYHSQENRQESQDQEKPKDENEPVERKTDKFAIFAMQYLEHFEEVNFARYRINMEQRKYEMFFSQNELDGLIAEKGAPEQEKDKKFEDYKYYYVEKNAILKTDKGCIRIGINELKYFVLLSLDGQGGKAKGQIDSFISKFTKANLVNASLIKSNRKDIPPFILKSSGIDPDDEQKRTS